MISVIVPTHDSAAVLGACLSALVPAAVTGLVREVILADGGSVQGAVRALCASIGAVFSATASGLLRVWPGLRQSRCCCPPRLLCLLCSLPEGGLPVSGWHLRSTTRFMRVC